MCSSRSCLSLYVLELRRGAKLYIGISDYISEFLITTWNGWLINEAINTYNVTEVWTRPSNKNPTLYVDELFAPDYYTKVM